jgi:hypothetical protein
VSHVIAREVALEGFSRFKAGKALRDLVSLRGRGGKSFGIMTEKS